jgi:hypothetical protein
VAHDVAVLVADPVPGSVPGAIAGSVPDPAAGPAGRGAPSPPQLRPADGRLVGAHAALGLRPGAPWRGRVLWRYGAVVGGDTLRRAAGAGRGAPGGRLARVERAPDPAPRGCGELARRRDVDRAPGPRAPRRPASAPTSALDLTVRQSAWRGRVAATVLVRNALGQRERYHPEGAELARRWYAAAEIGWP